MRPLAFAAALATCLMSGVSGQAQDVSYEVLEFHDLKGWRSDNHDAALQVFLETCGDLKDPEWKSLCKLAKTQTKGRPFFELFFKPVLIEDGNPMLFTGYFEPELSGSLTKTSTYRYPLYRKPPEVRNGSRWLSREQIETTGALDNRGLEIAWIDDPVDVFFLHIQGSGRVRLEDGSTIRVGYGGKNGHNYRSVGQELVRRGVYTKHQVSAQVIRNWVKRNPVEGAKLLHHNPSYVFFREVTRVPSDKGPLGAMNRSITSMRSIAVDPKFTPLGAPVWIEKGGSTPMRRLMIAQDTGSAIKGAQRADIFYGTGNYAGRRAGETRDPGRMIVLMPIAQAFALVGEA